MLKLLTSFYMHNFVHPTHFLKLVVSKTSIIAAIICWLVPLLSVFHVLAVVVHLHYLNPYSTESPSMWVDRSVSTIPYVHPDSAANLQVCSMIMCNIYFKIINPFDLGFWYWFMVMHRIILCRWCIVFHKGLTLTWTKFSAHCITLQLKVRLVFLYSTKANRLHW